MRDYLELVRAKAALTVIGDTLAGGAWAGRGLGAGTLALPLSSALLYSAGMALNDYSDAELDARERPERPIPSGRIRRSAALGTAAVLTAAGVAVAAVVDGRRSLALSLPLAATIWSYDLLAKPTPLGPVVMAACRGLDVLLGAGADGVRAAAPASAAVAAHTLGVTVLSRGEVHGTTPVAAGAAAAGTASIALSTAGGVLAERRAAPAAVVTAGLGRWLLLVLTAQLQASRTPTAAAARTATRAGITGMIPLQAALTGLKRPELGAALLALDALGSLLLRRPRTADIT
ncbi:4-hydroxybenzoate polyprenyltransferase [Rathayibacter tritici]|nr:4-hydroxybenzoate polyprenyltransferase [Rathayibacter tritici]PPF65764.1 4-hydroxybenzoate polyprenyltransferase [Rathayibacter tritici]PPG07583.1 4-hydroxybenzoate polyprenyltransferase [Rathayibacter tritici]PPI17397.1 4-hydroxybenzoate polyprenyltransferase [Rathayibacter tritici]PPI46452.1 4-hydroxybenzoate polyprenyltransferase [Rathayibacter tritici]